MDTSTFIAKLRSTPQQIRFADTMQVIREAFTYYPTAFENGDLQNKAGENEGSCKLFAFAKFFNLSQQETLYCFGEYYQDVLENPNVDNHQNIRNFMKTGWAEITFKKNPLTLK